MASLPDPWSSFNPKERFDILNMLDQIRRTSRSYDGRSRTQRPRCPRDTPWFADFIQDNSLTDNTVAFTRIRAWWEASSCVARCSMAETIGCYARDLWVEQIVTLFSEDNKATLSHILEHCVSGSTL